MSTSSSTFESTTESPGRKAEHRFALLERERRRIEAEMTELLGVVDRHHLYREDGHLSARSWAAAIANWSPNEATSRLRTARACAALPGVHAAFGSGELGVAQAHAFGRAHANPRVVDDLPASEAPLLQDALALSFDEFSARLRTWTELADADGAHRKHQGAHRMRHARLHSIGSETLLSASYGNVDGAVIREIFEAFRDTEFAADVGAAGPGGVLPRTDAQRSADALLAVFRAAAEGGRGGKLDIVVDLVIDQTTFENELRRLAGAEMPRSDPATYRTYRCETLDGTSLDPAEVLAAGLIGSIRRVVIDAASMVIDMGRQRRFARAARHALLLRDRHCAYAGCNVPARHTQGDHIDEHSRGGRTNPANGDLMCPRHNRFKNHGYRTARDRHGHWHTYRPDGTEVGRPHAACVR